jgi:hypothetical protein
MKSLPGSGYFSKYYIALDGRFNRNANCIESTEIAQPSGTQRVYADEFISTMPLADLIAWHRSEPTGGGSRRRQKAQIPRKQSR